MNFAEIFNHYFWLELLYIAVGTWNLYSVVKNIRERGGNFNLAYGVITFIITAGGIWYCQMKYMALFIP